MTAAAYRVAEFARMAGVTVRTLQYYDRIGLLQPRKLTEGGHRLYEHADLLRLQQILTLKWMGFSLEQIRTILESPAYDLATALQAQKRALDQKIAELQEASHLIETALGAAENTAMQELPLETVRAIIHSVTSNEEDDWARQFFSAEAWAGIIMRRQQYTEADFARFEQQWKDLYAAFAAVQHLPPDDDAVQKLAATMHSYLQIFSGGDPQVEQGMKRLYAQEALPQQMHMADDELQQFVQAAYDHYRKAPNA